VTSLRPLAVRDCTAAKLLDMSVERFRRLVAEGALPPPARIGPDERWRVDELDAILRGDAARPRDEFEL